MIYLGIVLTLVDGEWFAWDKGNVIAQGSKSQVFEAIDRLMSLT